MSPTSPKRPRSRSAAPLAPRVVLASASPRRLALLRQAGFRVQVEPANIDERRRRGERPAAYVRRLARAKAAVVAARMPPEALVLAADTAVVIGSRILGKPASSAAAARMLKALSGRRHRVLTGVSLLCRSRRWSRTFVATTWVWMRPLGADEIRAYVATAEPLDKAGAYAIQGGAARFVTKIRGLHSNVVGLPLERVVALLMPKP